MTCAVTRSQRYSPECRPSWWGPRCQPRLSAWTGAAGTAPSSPWSSAMSLASAASRPAVACSASSPRAPQPRRPHQPGPQPRLPCPPQRQPSLPGPRRHGSEAQASRAPRARGGAHLIGRTPRQRRPSPGSPPRTTRRPSRGAPARSPPSRHPRRPSPGAPRPGLRPRTTRRHSRGAPRQAFHPCPQQQPRHRPPICGGRRVPLSPLHACRRRPSMICGGNMETTLRRFAGWSAGIPPAAQRAFTTPTSSTCARCLTSALR
mmetsp:Transcript_12347/g.29326  ORF Transcript_12347/g.29326 Transcript_12347/m.29326 type:complete len:261 (+) Transcript_12347:1098-1880(+)